tara:strand:+ start:505 stop:747 length:243 start_codon:yes stop_codon:yes gene_type:complete
MWQDEMFEEIQIGDRVWYETPQGQQASGKAKIRGPEGWVLDTENGAKVVNDGYNYLGHTPAKNRKPDHFGNWLNGHEHNF